MSARPWLVRIHRYLALGAGVLVALIGVTGATLVFKDALQDLAHPERRLTPAAGAAYSYDAVLQAAMREAPGAKRYSFHTFGDPAHAVRVDAEGGEGRRLFIDPYSGRVLGNAGRTDATLDWVERLHTHLLAGEAGEYVVGILGGVLFVLAVTGLIQGWPQRWRTTFRVRWGAAHPWLAYDLHRCAGLVFALFLVVNAVTGATLVFSGFAGRVVNKLAAAPPKVEPQLPPAPAGAPRASLDEVVRAAERAIPDGRVTRLTVPGARSPISVRLRTPDDHHPFGLGTVTLDPTDASVLAVNRTSALAPGTRMFDWLYPLHVGRLFGTAYSAWHVLVGLSSLALLVSGLLVWTGRRRARAESGLGPRRRA